MMMKSGNKFAMLFLAFLCISVDNALVVLGENSRRLHSVNSSLRYTAKRQMFSIGWNDYWDDVKSGVQTATTATVDATKTVTGDVVDTTKSVAGDVADTTKTVAGDVVDTTKTVAGDVVDTTKTAAGDVVDTTKTVAGDVVDTTKTVAGDVADTTKTVAGDVVDTTKTVTGDVVDTTKTVAGDVVDATKTVVDKVGCGDWGNTFFQDVDQFAVNKGCVYGLDIAACIATDGAGCVEEVAGATAGAIIAKVLSGADTTVITDTINIFLERLGDSLGITIPECATGFIVTQLTGGDIADPASLICTVAQDCLCSTNCGC